MSAGNEYRPCDRLAVAERVVVQHELLVLDPHHDASVRFANRPQNAGVIGALGKMHGDPIRPIGY